MKLGVILLVFLLGVGLVSAVSNPAIFGHQSGEINWAVSGCGDGLIMIGIRDTGEASCAPASFNSLSAEDGSPAQAVFVDNAGNVGIGTTSPSYTLDVVGNVRLNGVDSTLLIRDSNGGSNNQAAIGVRDSKLHFWDGASDPWNNIMTLDMANLRVGIGTTSPGAKLEIHNSDDTSIEPFKIFNDNGNYIAGFEVGSAGDGYLRIKQNDGDMVLSVDGATGRVGIGITSPSVALDVVGNIKASGTICDGNGDCVGGGGGSGNCVSFETPVTSGDEFFEVSLINNGVNVCEEPYGCEMLIYKKNDVGGDITDMNGDTSYRYIQNANGKYRENLNGESSGVNGDGSNTEIMNWLNVACNIYDDKTDKGFTASKDTLILKDSDNNEKCVVVFCRMGG